MVPVPSRHMSDLSPTAPYTTLRYPLFASRSPRVKTSQTTTRCAAFPKPLSSFRTIARRLWSFKATNCATKWLTDSRKLLDSWIGRTTTSCKCKVD